MKTEPKFSVQKLVIVGVFAALLAVLSQISIPMPSGVPITLQTFAVALCAYVLGWKLGAAAVAVYLALGAAGLPVFAGFSGGVGTFLHLTGGYLWGFLLMSVLCGLGAKCQNRILAIFFGCAGLLLCHLCGAAQFALVSQIGFVEAFALASLPYLLKDVISVGLAYFLAQAVLSALRRAKLFEGKL